MEAYVLFVSRRYPELLPARENAPPLSQFSSRAATSGKHRGQAAIGLGDVRQTYDV